MPNWTNRVKHKYTLADLAAKPLKVMLMGSGYSFDPDHDYVSSASGSELAVSGYTGGYGGSGRKSLVNLAVENVAGGGYSRLVADPLLWTALSSPTVAGAWLIWETGGSDATAELIVHVNLAAAFTLGSGASVWFKPTEMGIGIRTQRPSLTTPVNNRYQAYNRANQLYSLQTMAGKTLKALLVKSTYVFDPDHDYVADIVADEATVGGYARQTLANVTSGQDNTLNRGKLTWDPFVFGAFSGIQELGGAVVFISNGSDATDELVGFMNKSFPVTTENSAKALTLTPGTSGVILDT